MQPTSRPGLYLLQLHLKKTFTTVAAGRDRAFTSGYYAYAGSAQGGLRGRLNRHINGPHSGHWHIDTLLEHAAILDIQLQPDATDECRLAKTVADWPDAQPMNGLGASDCRCPTHLFLFKHRPGQSLLAQDALGQLDSMFCELRKCYRNHALDERDPFQTLVGCILSLRTQDPVTHAAMDRLFAPCPTPDTLLATPVERIAELIYPVGMYRQKARRIREIAKIVRDQWNNVVSPEIDELLTLPGVGRKTANLVRSFAFHLPAICVDTHVHRITNRWCLVRTTTPDETEMELRRILPEPFWIETNALLIQLGQTVCRPLRPQCDRCPLRNLCQYHRLKEERGILDTLNSPPPHPTLKHLHG